LLHFSLSRLKNDDREFRGPSSITAAAFVLLMAILSVLNASADETRQDVVKILFFNTKGNRISDTLKREVIADIADADDGIDVSGFAEQGTVRGFEELITAMMHESRQDFSSAISEWRGHNFLSRAGHPTRSSLKVAAAAPESTEMNPLDSECFDGFFARPDVFPMFSRMPIVADCEISKGKKTLRFSIIFCHLTSTKFLKNRDGEMIHDKHGNTVDSNIGQRVLELKGCRLLMDHAVATTGNENVILFGDLNADADAELTLQTCSDIFSLPQDGSMIVSDEATYIPSPSEAKDIPGIDALELDWAIVRPAELAQRARISVYCPDDISAITSWTLVKKNGKTERLFDHHPRLLEIEMGEE
jgi:hypothetical protein